MRLQMFGFHLYSASAVTIFLEAVLKPRYTRIMVILEGLLELVVAIVVGLALLSSGAHVVL